jgi:hypothetical protein
MNKIEILFSLDSKSNYLNSVLKTALMELKMNISIIKIDKHEIESSMSLQRPALFINDKLVLQGRVPAIKELKEIIQKEIEK